MKPSFFGASRLLSEWRDYAVLNALIIGMVNEYLRAPLFEIVECINSLVAK